MTKPRNQNTEARRRLSLILGALLACGPILPAQESEPAPSLGFDSLGNGLRFRCVHVAGVTGVCAVVMWRVGTVHDPAGATGLASVVGEVMRRDQSSLPLAQRWSVGVRASSTVLTAVTEPEDLRSLLARFRTLLAGEMALEGDALQRSAGSAALEADSQVHIVPGTALRWVARRSLLESTAVGRQGIGIPAELKRLEPALIRDRYRELYRPRNALIVLCGGASEGAMVAALRGAFEDLPGGDHAVPPPIADGVLGRPAETAEHDRVAAPYVTLALCAPDPADPDYLPFAVAMEIVKARAALALRGDRGRGGVGALPPCLL